MPFAAYISGALAGFFVGACVAVAFGAVVGVGAGVAVGSGVTVGVGTGVAVGSGVTVGVGIGVAVGSGVVVAVGPSVGVGTGVAVGDGVTVSVGPAVAVGSGEAVAAGIGASVGCEHAAATMLVKHTSVVRIRQGKKYLLFFIKEISVSLVLIILFYRIWGRNTTRESVRIFCRIGKF